MAVVLHDGVEAAPKQLLERWFDNPAFLLGRLEVDDSVQFVQFVAKVKLVPRSRASALSHIEIILHYIVVSQLRDGYEALQASIHVAVKSVVLKTHNPVCKVRCDAVVPYHGVRLPLLLSFVV